MTSSNVLTNRKCQIYGCVSTHYGKGFCHLHWKRWKYLGSASAVTIRDSRPALIDGDIARVPLGVNAKGGYAIVDKEYAWISKYKWIARKRGQRCEGLYAFAKVNGTKSTPVPMHRLIMKTPVGMDTDHINNNGLDSRRENLRIVNRTINNFNSRLRANNTSGLKGVSWSPRANLWRAYIGGSKKRLELGYFKTANEAHKARLASEKGLIYE